MAERIAFVPTLPKAAFVNLPYDLMQSDAQGFKGKKLQARPTTPGALYGRPRSRVSTARRFGAPPAELTSYTWHRRDGGRMYISTLTLQEQLVAAIRNQSPHRVHPRAPHRPLASRPPSPDLKARSPSLPPSHPCFRPPPCALILPHLFRTRRQEMAAPPPARASITPRPFFSPRKTCRNLQKSNLLPTAPRLEGPPPMTS
jgi:hypothetical protein